MAAALVAIHAFSTVVQAVAFTLLIGAVVVLHLREISHPLTWFGPVFWLYSMSYPLLALSGLYPYDDHLQQAVFLHAIAFVAFSIPLIGVRRPLDPSGWDPRGMKLRAGISGMLALVLGSLAALLIMQLATLGISTKRELIDADLGISSTIASLLSLLTFVVIVHFACQLHRRRPVMPVVTLALGCGVLAIAMMGERDVILRLVFVGVLLYWDFRRRPRLPVLITLFVLTLLALPLLQSLKGVGLGSVGEYRFEVVSILAQEFRGAMQNTYNVLAMGLDRTVSGVQPIAWDLVRAASPNVLGLDAQSTTQWYNEVVLFDVESGRGFTLVGYGYLVGGVLGVCVLYGALGLLFRKLYWDRGRSYMALTVFGLMAPLLMYAQRGDLSTLLSQSARSIFLPALLFGLAMHLIRRVHGTEAESANHPQLVKRAQS